MKDLIRLTDLSREEISGIFRTADELYEGKHGGALSGKCVVMFFPASSIRTRVTFEKGIGMLGGQPILFPSETLDKKEDIRDVFGYLDNWADAVIIRHRSIELVERIAGCSDAPVINAMTDANHPCEILSDLYALSKIRPDYLSAKYLFCGRSCNIGLAWREAAEVLGLDLVQACPEGYEMEGVRVFRDAGEAVAGRDIILTDSLPAGVLGNFADFRVTAGLLDRANKGAVLNPCPPFFRGEEVSSDAIESEHFVGYGFKKHLLRVQQAVMIHCMS